MELLQRQQHSPVRILDRRAASTGFQKPCHDACDSGLRVAGKFPRANDDGNPVSRNFLHFADLPSTLVNQARAEAGVASAVAVGGQVGSSQPAIIPLHELEKRAIRQALEFTHGDRTVAAQMLGIGRTTLYRKLKEYQVGEC